MSYSHLDRFPPAWRMVESSTVGIPWRARSASLDHGVERLGCRRFVDGHINAITKSDKASSTALSTILTDDGDQYHPVDRYTS